MTETFMTVPLSKLQPARDNVRKTEATVGVEELAASIAAHGLLQNLTIRPIAKAKGKPSGRFEVVAGCRRLAALRLLVKRKHIKKSYSVPCHLMAEGNPVEVSLAENIVRAPMHPADQFEAFSALHAEGLGIEDIAARFGISPTVVRQRLKLAAVSPRLMAVYRTGDMNLEQLMAFTVSDDHEAQERVWFESPYYDKHPQAIRRALTKMLVEGGDRRARFIGVEAYEAAGGTVVRDLFQPEDDGYFADSALLDQLVAEKLSAESEKVKAEGWSWVEVLPEMDYAYLTRFHRIPPVPKPLSEEEQGRLDELSSRYDAIIEELGEDPPAEVDEELSRLQQEIEEISEGREEWPPEEMAQAGALITLDYHGALHIERGLVKPEDREHSGGDGTTGEKTPEKHATKAKSGVSDALVEVLTAHRTAALQVTLAEQPELAFTALLHTLVLRIFYGLVHETCLDVTPVTHGLSPFSEGSSESKAVAAMAERHREWLERLPAEEKLWTWLVAQDRDNKLALLAYCTAKTLNAVRHKRDGSDSERLVHAEMLADAAGLDMADWWEATKESYFGRVTKALILAAVAETVSSQAAGNIAGMKKDAMAARAEDLLIGKRWLPEILRTRSRKRGNANGTQETSHTN